MKIITYYAVNLANCEGRFIRPASDKFVSFRVALKYYNEQIEKSPGNVHFLRIEKHVLRLRGENDEVEVFFKSDTVEIIPV
jgi:hypothetical protein